MHIDVAKAYNYMVCVWHETKEKNRKLYTKYKNGDWCIEKVNLRSLFFFVDLSVVCCNKNWFM